MVVKLRNTSNFSPKKRKKEILVITSILKLKTFFLRSHANIYIYIYEYDLPLVLF